MIPISELHRDYIKESYYPKNYSIYQSQIGMPNVIEGYLVVTETMERIIYDKEGIIIALIPLDALVIETPYR